jgi:V/A-type H+-transporting ATPase subunit I
VAASSRKGRFALDTELKKAGFIPLAIPEGFKGVPSELLSGLEVQALELEQKLKSLELDKQRLGEEYGPILGRLSSSFRMAVAVEELKGHLIATHSFYSLSGWVAAEDVTNLICDLERLTDGRIALRSFDPEEISAVRDGREKVPVSLDHGAFVKSFEPLVFSYGAPLYGTIDPTLFVALSFTVLFGIMFGDVGQGFVLFLLGYFVGRKKSGFLTNFKRFAIPLRAVGAASMAVGFLDGEVFSNEELLIRPTRAITGFFTGVPVDRILQLMPEKGSLDKLFLFFAFTIGVGVVINSIGLVINIINQASLGRWEKALFAKTGLAGAFLFWYALFMGVRLALGGTFAWFDILGISSTALALFVGPALWRLITGKRPILEHGPLVFFMEGFVELLETASSYISNTVSFLRVGAFALSHAVLSFIVFSLSEMVSAQPFGGPFFALIVVVFGNAVIILLEGMIVAIQVIRLQYYEFFSKFFTETGVEFSPFRFRREV